MRARRCNPFPAAIAIVLLSGIALAQQKVERIALPTRGLPEAILHDVEEKGYRLTLDHGWIADFWPTEQLLETEKTVAGALYPKIEPSAFVGIIVLHQDMPDYRGQTIRAGAYTLRYELLPQDGNHLGVSPNPDFLLAIPANDDPNPVQPWVLKHVVAMSSKSTGTNHPAVIALENAGEPGTMTKSDQGAVFSVAIPTGPGSEKLGICFTCSASQ